VRLADGEPVEAAEYAVLLERWTSVGAQVHPAPNVVLERDDLDPFLASNRIVYSAGRPGDRVWIVRIVDAGGA
jgi:hypothetical protein